MRTPRLFVDLPLDSGDLIQLPDAAAHHVGHVLRMRPQQEITLFNGQGGEYPAVIESIHKKQVQVKVGAFVAKDRESPLKITLAQGLSKSQKMDFTIQKAVELGVSRIVPILNERSTVVLKTERLPKRLEHWRNIMISACEQCGRNRLPTIEIPMSVSDWLSQDTNSSRLFLDPMSSTSMSDLTVTEQGLTVLVGSEGGFTDSERQQALQAGYQAVHLGSRVLRTETAALAVLVLCQGHWGDLG